MRSRWTPALLLLGTIVALSGIFAGQTAGGGHGLTIECPDLVYEDGRYATAEDATPRESDFNPGYWTECWYTKTHNTPEDSRPTPNPTFHLTWRTDASEEAALFDACLGLPEEPGEVFLDGHMAKVSFRAFEGHSEGERAMFRDAARSIINQLAGVARACHEINPCPPTWQTEGGLSFEVWMGTTVHSERRGDDRFTCHYMPQEEGPSRAYTFEATLIPIDHTDTPIARAWTCDEEETEGTVASREHRARVTWIPGPDDGGAAYAEDQGWRILSNAETYAAPCPSDQPPEDPEPTDGEVCPGTLSVQAGPAWNLTGEDVGPDEQAGISVEEITCVYEQPSTAPADRGFLTIHVFYAAEPDADGPWGCGPSTGSWRFDLWAGTRDEALSWDKQVTVNILTTLPDDDPSIDPLIETLLTTPLPGGSPLDRAQWCPELCPPGDPDEGWALDASQAEARDEMDEGNRVLERVTCRYEGPSGVVSLEGLYATSAQPGAFWGCQDLDARDNEPFVAWSAGRQATVDASTGAIEDGQGLADGLLDALAREAIACETLCPPELNTGDGSLQLAREYAEDIKDPRVRQVGCAYGTSGDDRTILLVTWHTDSAIPEHRMCTGEADPVHRNLQMAGWGWTLAHPDRQAVVLLTATSDPSDEPTSSERSVMDALLASVAKDAGACVTSCDQRLPGGPSGSARLVAADRDEITINAREVERITCTYELGEATTELQLLWTTRPHPAGPLACNPDAASVAGAHPDVDAGFRYDVTLPASQRDLLEEAGFQLLPAAVEQGAISCERARLHATPCSGQAGGTGLAFTIEHVEGDVQLFTPGAGWVDAQPGQDINDGQAIETGDEGRVILVPAGASPGGTASTTLGPGSLLCTSAPASSDLLGTAIDRVLDLARGSLHARDGGAGTVYRAGGTTAREDGTAFLMTHDPASQRATFTVQEGAITIDQDGETARLEEGEAAVASGQGLLPAEPIDEQGMEASLAAAGISSQASSDSSDGGALEEEEGGSTILWIAAAAVAGLMGYWWYTGQQRRPPPPSEHPYPGQGPAQPGHGPGAPPGNAPPPGDAGQGPPGPPGPPPNPP